MIAKAAAQGIRTRKRGAYFCSRLPGYAAFADRMTAEQYAGATTVIDGKSVALDPQVRFYDSLGATRVRLVRLTRYTAAGASCLRPTFRAWDDRFAGPSPWSAIFESLATRSKIVELAYRMCD